MADHSELVAEMLILEQMGTQERQKLAKKRRIQQIKKWSQREKEWMAKEKQMNKRLASKISEENNGLNLKHYTQYPLSEKSPTIRSPTTHLNSGAVKNNNNTSNFNNGIIKYKQNNISKTSGLPSNINNNILRKNPININSRSVSLNGLDAQDLYNRPTNGKVHFDSGVMLLEAAARNDLNEVKRLLMLGVSPDSTNHDGLTTLHQGCIEASEPMINLLLEFGANVDARDTEQWTPLHAACTCGHLKLVRILVEHGADLLAINGDGNMPFDLCEDEQTLDYLESQMVAKGITQEMIDSARVSTETRMITEIQQIINNGVDIKSITYANNVTPAHVASANGYLSALKFLIKHGADITAQDNDLWQPLHGVACWGNEQHIKVIELLIESGASLDAKTINDETVFDLCDNEQILEKLNEIKDEIESKLADGDRLKRTQSRTNSRIHSIRRTSTRDKSQISRRDAREEALLRSESSGMLPNIDGIKLGNATTKTALINVELNGDEDEYYNSTLHDSNDNLKNENVINHEDMQKHSFSKIKLANGSLEASMKHKLSIQVDNGFDTNHLVTDLDADQTTTIDNNSTTIKNYQQHQEVVHENKQHINNSTNHGSQQIKNNGTSQSLIRQQNSMLDNTNSHKLQQQHQQHQIDDTSPIDVNQKEKIPAAKEQYRSIDTNYALNGVQFNHHLDYSAQNSKHIDNESKNNRKVTNQANDLHHKKGSSILDVPNHHNSINETQTANQSITTMTSGSKVIVQFNSTNYTLSNLKKQRSDIRMRATTGLGIGSLNNNSSTGPVGADEGEGDEARSRYGGGSNCVNSKQLDNHSYPDAQQARNNQDYPDSIAVSRQEQQHWSAKNNGIGFANNKKHKIKSGKLSNKLDSSEERPLQSPTSSLRRFRGEPSELIGGDERSVKHGCCSII